MAAAVALVVTHERVTAPPRVTLPGVAVSVHVGASGGTITVTVFEQITVPPAPVAVSVYPFVALGATTFEPFCSTEPIPSLITTDDAFVVVHVSTDVAPRLI
jgi:hypothetical protein